MKPVIFKLFLGDHQSAYYQFKDGVFHLRGFIYAVNVRDLVMSAVVVGAWIWLAYLLIFIG